VWLCCLIQLWLLKLLVLLPPSLPVFERRRHDPTALNRQGNDVGTQYRGVWGAGGLMEHHNKGHRVHGMQHSWSSQSLQVALATVANPRGQRPTPAISQAFCEALTGFVVRHFMACAAGIYTHTPEQLEQAGKYLEEKRAAMPAVKIVTELEPINKYYKAEVRRLCQAAHS